MPKTSKTKKHATWGGRFSKGPAELMQRFGESVSFDYRLAPYDIRGSQAHARMLASIGIITAKERDAIVRGLNKVHKDIKDGKFKWDPALEDVHMNIEQALTKNVPAAAKLHTARSRNDQIATDMRLFFKDACAQLENEIVRLIGTLLKLAEKKQTTHIPGYTHLQRAQPVSIAHHILAWVEMLGRDRQRIQQVAQAANYCPLGSGAIAGTTLPIDRKLVATDLGFVDARGTPQLTQNSMDAVSDRDLFIEFANACALSGIHLSRIAEDLILWSSVEFGYIRLPDTFTTGSSLMPQKKNPDSLELIRGKSARLQGNLQTLYTMVKGLPLTYNRDLQEDKPPVFDSFDQLKICLQVLEGTLKGARIDDKACKIAVSDPALLATDLVDHLVQQGVPFREAHHIIGAVVGLAEKHEVLLDNLTTEDLRNIDSRFGDDWQSIFNIERAMKARERPGMPGPRQIKTQIARWRKILG